MYADITTSRVNQHRAAMEKHARAAHQAKIARSAASQTRRVTAAEHAPRVRGWSVTGLLARRAQSAARPATV
jgi:hypothetical protein